MNRVRITAAFLAAGLLAACTTAPGPDANNDPYEHTNRQIFALDVKFDRILLAPTAEAYDEYVPGGVREGAHNVLANLDAPVTFVNDVLQAEPCEAGHTFARFALNTTAGLGGIFDVAEHLGIASHTEDFGLTLGKWGIGEGPYMVLPMLGPDPPRDAFGQVADFAFDPTVYVHLKQHIWWAAGRQVFTILDVRARNLDTLADIERNSLDYYATTRSLYRQLRNSEIKGGETPPEN